MTSVSFMSFTTLLRHSRASGSDWTRAPGFSLPSIRAANLHDLLEEPAARLPETFHEKHANSIDLELPLIPLLIHVYLRSPRYLAQLGLVNHLLGPVPILAFTCNIRQCFSCDSLDLDEPDHAVLLGNDVYLPPRAAMISLYYAESLHFQVLSGDSLPYLPHSPAMCSPRVL